MTFFKSVYVKIYKGKKYSQVNTVHKNCEYAFHVFNNNTPIINLQIGDIVETGEGPIPWVNPVVIVPKEGSGKRLLLYVHAIAFPL